MIRYALPYPPSTNTLFANVKGGRVKSEGYARWIRHAQSTIVEQGHRKMPGNVSLSIALVKPDKRRRDLSNTIKAIEDVLVSMRVIEDDSLVQKISIQWIPAGDPCTVLIHQAAQELDRLTSDDVMDRIDGEASTHELRALGPIMLAAAKHGWIAKADCMAVPSRRTSLHASPRTVWLSRLRVAK